MKYCYECDKDKDGRMGGHHFFDDQNKYGRFLPTGHKWVDDIPPCNTGPKNIIDEYGINKYIIDEGGHPILQQIQPTQEQINDKKDKEYKQLLTAAMPDIIDKCTSWEEVEAEKQKLKDKVSAKIR